MAFKLPLKGLLLFLIYLYLFNPYFHGSIKVGQHLYSLQAEVKRHIKQNKKGQNKTGVKFTTPLDMMVFLLISHHHTSPHWHLFIWQTLLSQWGTIQVRFLQGQVSQPSVAPPDAGDRSRYCVFWSNDYKINLHYFIPLVQKATCCKIIQTNLFLLW